MAGGTIVAYLKQHPWRRRALILLLAVAIGGALYPVLAPLVEQSIWVQKYRLIRQLRSRDVHVRAAGIKRAALLAQSDSRIEQALNDELASADDSTFEAIALALDRSNRFDKPGRNVEHIDRFHALLLADPSLAADQRRVMLVRILLSGRSNEQVRRAAQTGASDAQPQVRMVAATLAAAISDDRILGTLLDDADPQVSAIAAMDIGLAGRKALVGRVESLFASRAAAWHGRLAHVSHGRLAHEGAANTQPTQEDVAEEVEVLSACALTLRRFDLQEKLILDLLNKTANSKSPAGQLLRDRLLHVLAAYPSKAGSAAVANLLDRCNAGNQYPPAATLLAGGKLHLPQVQVQQAVRTILADVTGGGKLLPVALVRAALQAACDADARVRPETFAFCDRLWSQGDETSLVLAARLLGRTAMTQDDTITPPGPTTRDCRVLLAKMAAYMAHRTVPGSDRVEIVRTPLPSAAAAVALWELDDPAAPDALRSAAGSELALPGQYIAWHVARSRRGKDPAFAMGLKMLPSLNAPPEQREYANNTRAAGAMLLALAAHTPQQRQQAIDRITSRMEGSDFGGEQDKVVRAAFQCALLILRQDHYFSDVRVQLDVDICPLRTPITALTTRGDRTGMDWALWGLDEPQLVELLMTTALYDVVNAVEGLPHIDAGASGDLLTWQARISREAYGIQSGKPLRLIDSKETANPKHDQRQGFSNELSH